MSYDVLVIGGGSGGLAFAKRAASLGASVGLVEKSRVGGTCVIRGCIPKKIMSFVASYLNSLEDMVGYGLHVGSSYDFKHLVAYRDAEVERLETLHKTKLTDAGVTFIPGEAQFINAHTVRVGREEIRAQRIVIAVGSRPAIPVIEGMEHGMSSDGVWDLQELPKRLTVVGAGYIALELASIFCALGSTVTLVVRGEALLRGFDPDVQALTLQHMQQQGIEVKFGREISALHEEKDGTCVVLDDGTEFHTDHVLFATGRIPNTQPLKAHKAALTLGEDYEVIVNENLQAKGSQHIYALGDCNNRVTLTPVAVRDGRWLAEHLFGDETTVPPLTYDDVPTAVFTQPGIGVVGLTEPDAIATYGADALIVNTMQFRPMQLMLAQREERVLMKVIALKRNERVVGVHLVGRDAPELIQLCGVWLKAGVTLTHLRHTVAVHPSVSEELVLGV